MLVYANRGPQLAPGNLYLSGRGFRPSAGKWAIGVDGFERKWCILTGLPSLISGADFARGQWVTFGPDTPAGRILGPMARAAGLDLSSFAEAAPADDWAPDPKDWSVPRAQWDAYGISPLNVTIPARGAQRAFPAVISGHFVAPSIWQQARPTGGAIRVYDGSRFVGDIFRERPLSPAEDFYSRAPRLDYLGPTAGQLSPVWASYSGFAPAGRFGFHHPLGNGEGLKIAWVRELVKVGPAVVYCYLCPPLRIGCLAARTGPRSSGDDAYLAFSLFLVAASVISAAAQGAAAIAIAAKAVIAAVNAAKLLINRAAAEEQQALAGQVFLDKLNVLPSPGEHPDLRSPAEIATDRRQVQEAVGFSTLGAGLLAAALLL